MLGAPGAVRVSVNPAERKLSKRNGFALVLTRLFGGMKMTAASGDESPAGSVLLQFYWNGGLAQLARAPALQAGGQRFESVILHSSAPCIGEARNRSQIDMMEAKSQLKKS